jgi:hypothetical protein
MVEFDSKNPAKLVYEIEVYTQSIEEKYHQMMWETLGNLENLYGYLKEKFVVFEIPPFDTTIFPGYYSDSLKKKLKNDFKNSLFGQFGPNMTNIFFQKVDYVIDHSFKPEKWESIQKDYEEDLDKFSIILAEKYYSLPHVADFLDTLDLIVSTSPEAENPEEFFKDQLRCIVHSRADINNLWEIKKDEILPDIKIDENFDDFSPNGLVDEMNNLISKFKSD